MTLSLSTVRIPSAVGARGAGAPSLATYFTVWKQRRELANLSSARLQDLGITPEAAAQEAARHVWDLPCHMKY